MLKSYKKISAARSVFQFATNIDLYEIHQHRDATETARSIFGADLVEQELKRITTVLVGSEGRGYSESKASKAPFRQALSLLFLLNRSPYLEDLSCELLKTAIQRRYSILHPRLTRIAQTLQELDLSYLIAQSPEAIEPLHTCSSADWSYLQDLTLRLRSQVQQFSTQGLNWGVCHGDCHMLNDHIADDQTITFFDFDCCAPGWRAYDLAIVRWSEGFYQMDPENALWHAFLKGYTEHRYLSETDLASIPTFVALREIWHTALVAWLQPSSGVQGFDRILQSTLRLLREWETTQLQP